MPPFPVLLRWLEFYHTRTGHWPQPETLEEVAPGSPAEKPLLTLLPTLAFSNPSSAGLSDSRDQNQTGPRKPRIKAEAGAGNEIAGIEKETAKIVNKKEEEPLFKLAAAYNLKTSVYYHIAFDLIQRQAALSATGLLAQNLYNEETTLTLASFLAWCCLPAPENPAKPENDPVKMEMYLSLDRWSRLLKMRKATLGRCLKELSGAGLLEIVEANNPESDFSNIIKRGNRVYRLAVALPQPLPLFGLFQNSTEDTSLYEQEPSEKNGEPSLKQFRALETVGELEPQPEPTTMNHANNLKSKKIKTKKHEHEILAEGGTTDFTGEKLRFLLETASFPGYASPEGLITLAEKEAQKFATDPRLDLANLKRIYSQVLTTWSAGKCTRNPLGLFHYSLTHHLKQAAAATPARPTNQLPVPPSVDPAGTSSLKKNKDSSRPQTTLHKYKRVGSYGNVNSDPPQASPYSEQAHRSEEIRNPAFIDSKTEPITGLDFEEIKAGLQKHVTEALNNRFRQPGLASSLGQLDWVLSIVENKVRLELQNAGSHFLAASRLGQAELSLIKIALSQGLRTLTGKSLEIEVFLVS